MSRDALRAFFAVELPPHVREQAAAASAELRRHVSADPRWVPAENLHLTLKFLGSIDPDLVPRLLAASAARLVREQPFEVTLAGLGAFPSARDARVLWLGVASGAAALARLARKLDAAAARVGVERERRPYRAHLTLARLREPAPVALERATAPDAASFAVRDLVLYESRPAPDGARYVPLARLPLGQPDALECEFAPEL